MQAQCELLPLQIHSHKDPAGIGGRTTAAFAASVPWRSIIARARSSIAVSSVGMLLRWSRLRPVKVTTVTVGKKFGPFVRVATAVPVTDRSSGLRREKRARIAGQRLLLLFAMWCRQMLALIVASATASCSLQRVAHALSSSSNEALSLMRAEIFLISRCNSSTGIDGRADFVLITFLPRRPHRKSGPEWAASG